MTSHRIFVFLFLLCLFSFYDTAFADVTKLVFITDQQTVAVNTPSNTVTVQLQNSFGTQENATETIDLVFTSSSPTGQFLSATTPGNPVVARINSGTANKNFIYQDETAGTHTMKVTATGRTSLNTFFAEQQIIVTSTGQNNTESTTTQPTTTTTPPSNQTTPSVVSAHSSPAPLSDTEPTIEFEISAGRDRLTTVGNDLVFRAVPTKFQNMVESGITYYWSFGDGTVAQGNNVKHVYKFAGDYSVVVNANYSDKQAVARLSVKVITPNIFINKLPGGTEISNNSKTEINLEGWRLSSQTKTFVFPADTLIPSGNRVIFADDVTGMSDETIQLLNPLGKELGFVKKIDAEVPKPIVTNRTDVNLDDIQAKIEEVKNEVAQITGRSSAKRFTPGIVQVADVESSGGAGQAESSQGDENIGSGTANTATVFEATKQKGFVSTVFSWPIRGFNFVRRLFVEE